MNTVFVVGVGASAEANLPAGLELGAHIARLLNIQYDASKDRYVSGDHAIVTALKEYVRQSNGRPGDIFPYQQAGWRIRDAMGLAGSIDSFIHTHRDDDKIALCGKLAIVRAILDSEKRSLLTQDTREPNPTFTRLGNTWYPPFFRLLVGTFSKSELEARFKSITLIVFNYDRCIEHFLFNAVQTYHGCSIGEAADLVKGINIFHPYGVVGTLPWGGQNGTIEFGGEALSAQLLELSQKIRTFTEGNDPDASEILNIREHMRTADRVVFLGFAFHELNMTLITPDVSEATATQHVEFFATTHGLSLTDRGVIVAQIMKLYPNPSGVSLYADDVNLSCAGLFKEYGRSLSL